MVFKKIAYIGVVGDLFHYGHLQSIKFAKSLADHLICGVFTDKAVEEYRTKPIADLSERKAVLKELKCVDEIMIQENKDPTQNLKEIHSKYPNSKIILVHGDNWSTIPGSNYIKSINGETVKHPYYEKLSTYKILKALRKRHHKDLIDFASLLTKQEKNQDFDKQTATLILNKALTLKALEDRLTKWKIAKSFTFTVEDWKIKKHTILEHLKENFTKEIIIRRSPVLELNFKKPIFKEKYSSKITDNVSKEVDSIIKSYANSTEKYNHHILIQENKKIDKEGRAYIKNNETIVLFDNQELSLNLKKSDELSVALKELKDLVNFDLEVHFGISNNNLILFDIQPHLKQFVHAWGGRTSLQSLECHTLRYTQIPSFVNSIKASIYCPIQNGHHTIYFDKFDVSRWKIEGQKLLDKTFQENILKENLEQIKRYHFFTQKHKNKDYSNFSLHELKEVYEPLLNFVMENGIYFSYSRQEAIFALKNKILEMLDNNNELFQLLTTPTTEDLFLTEKKDRLKLYSNTNKEEILEYTQKHPWRFINTYSKENIFDFIKNELKEQDKKELLKEIKKTETENLNRKKEQEQHFKNNPELKRLCKFMQDASIIRLHNKNIWAGYEYLFLDLFQEITKRLNLTINEYLFSYRIKDTLNFLEKNQKLSEFEIKKRLESYTFEISNSKIDYDYKPMYEISVTKSEGLIGEVGNLGRCIGKARIVTDDGIDSLLALKKEMTSEDIYITTMTHPAMIPLLKLSKGIVTDEGGVTSHAAIVSRELNIPCLVGTKDATRVFKTGDYIEIDTYTKSVKKISQKEIEQYLAQRKETKSKKTTENSIITLKKNSVDQSINYIIPFQSKNGHEHVGGKGKSLMKCQSLHDVPNGFTITRRLFDEILHSYIKNKEFTINLDDKESLKKIREYILSYQFPKEFLKELNKNLENLNEPFAVRSSASCEDSQAHSFAGQFKSLLSIKKNNLNNAIKEVLSSAFIENVIFYFAHGNIDLNNFYMAVVIQEFIKAEKAGVVFTKHPTNKHSDSFVIEANFGVGESVVSGEVTPDIYFVSPDSIKSNISENKQVYSYENGKKSIVLKEGRVLNDKELFNLRELGEKLRKTYKCESEFEWAYYNGNLKLLQVRPITTLK